MLETLTDLKTQLMQLSSHNLIDAILFLLVLILLLILTRFKFSYSRLQKLQAEADKSWENIKVLLTQRNNEVPKLLNICRKRFSKNDMEKLQDAVSAKKHITAATTSNDVGKLSIAETMLRKELLKIMALAKNYPELISTQDFKMIKARLNGYNNAIGDRREIYNINAKEINERLAKRTGNMAAGILGVIKRDEFNVQVEQLGTNDLSTMFAS